MPEATDCCLIFVGCHFAPYCFAFAKQNGGGQNGPPQLMGLGTMTTKYISF